MPRTAYDIASDYLAAAEAHLAQCRLAVDAAALADALRLQDTHPEVYEMALCLENDGAFYRSVTVHATRDLAAGIGTPARRWRDTARSGVDYYRRHYAGDRAWTPPAGAVDLLAAYFGEVRYAELVHETRRGEGVT